MVEKDNEQFEGILICDCCGEYYDLVDFSREGPLEVCGECGSDFFIPYSQDCLKGFTSLGHYHLTRDFVPAHLPWPAEMTPRQSPFVGLENSLED